MINELLIRVCISDGYPFSPSSFLKMTLVGLASPFWNPSLKLAIYYINDINKDGPPCIVAGENLHNSRWSDCSATEQVGTASH